MDRDYVLERYQARNGQVPFTLWLDDKQRREKRTAYRVVMRLNRMQKGNFGDYKYLREGIWEMRIDAGPGYRLYFAFAQKQIVLLLIAGDKQTQKADISKAIEYWKHHQTKRNVQ
ncbi:addiction module killer protein [Enterobacteriaceae bacterium 89]|nr:addiction module killer protein [Enterobacteriaceae bacterium 89]